MTLPTFQRGIPGAPITCPRCTILQMMVDCDTGLCVECWRVVVLAPAALYLAAADLPGDGPKPVRLNGQTDP